MRSRVPLKVKPGAPCPRFDHVRASLRLSSLILSVGRVEVALGFVDQVTLAFQGFAQSVDDHPPMSVEVDLRALGATPTKFVERGAESVEIAEVSSPRVCVGVAVERRHFLTDAA